MEEMNNCQKLIRVSPPAQRGHVVDPLLELLLQYILRLRKVDDLSEPSISRTPRRYVHSGEVRTESRSSGLLATTGSSAESEGKSVFTAATAASRGILLSSSNPATFSAAPFPLNPSRDARDRVTSTVLLITCNAFPAPCISHASTIQTSQTLTSRLRVPHPE